MTFLNWRFGLTQTTPWRIELALSQICRTWLPPQNLSSPSQSPYMDTGMVIMPKGGPEGCAMGGSFEVRSSSSQPTVIVKAREAAPALSAVRNRGRVNLVPIAKSWALGIRESSEAD
jgi:hypothetical protein